MAATGRTFAAGTFPDGDAINFGDLDDLDSLTALSYALWVNTPNGEVSGRFISKLASNQGWSVQLGTTTTEIDARRLVVWAAAGSASWGKTPAVPPAYPATGWFHLAVVYDGAGATNADKLKLYIDGSQVAFDSFNGTIPAQMGATTQPLHLGWQGNWNGSQAHFAAWAGTVLTPTDITNLANGTNPLNLGTAPTRYARITGDDSPEPETVGGASGVVTGTTKAATAPPVDEPPGVDPATPDLILSEDVPGDVTVDIYDDTDPNTDNWELERSLDGSTGWTQIAVVSTWPYTDESLAPDEYFYRVRGRRLE